MEVDILGMHRALERQIKRYLKDLSISPELDIFFDALSETYTHFDEDRTLLDRSLELSSKEFIELNKRLAHEKEIIEQKVKERTFELEYEKKKLYEITQNMAIGAILLDSGGRVVFVNKAAEYILDCSNMKLGEVSGKFSTAFSSVSAREKLDKCIAGEPSEILEAEYNNKIFQILFRCIISGDSSEHLIWIQDITKAELLEKAKKEFVAIASHEMRTPLAIIRGQAELLLVTPAIKSTAQDIKDKLKSIYNSSARLLYIVNDFLDITWLEEKRIIFKKENFPITPLVEEVVSDIKKMAEQKGILLTFNKPETSLPNVLANRERLLQVITNLIANAIQYTEKGSITVDIAREGTYFLKVLVKDTGIGIEPEKQSLLFQKFQIAGKVFMESKEYGSGMGLYIAKLLVEQMGGTIKLEESRVGKGSTFSFTVAIAGSLPETNNSL